MSKTKKIIAAIVIVIAVAGFVGFGIWNVQKNGNQSGIPKDAIPVEAEKAHRETIISKVSAKGTVGFDKVNTVFASTSAKILTLNVKEGDEVKEGQVLAVYDVKYLEDLQEKYNEAELALRTSQLNLEAAKLPISNTDQLQLENAVNSAKKGLNDVQAQIEQTTVSIKQIERNIETAQKQYDDIKLLYNSGGIAKTELDTASESLNKLLDQKLTSELTLETQKASTVNAEAALKLAQDQLASARNKLSDPKVKNQISTLEIAIEQAKMGMNQITKQMEEFVPDEKSTFSGTVISLNASEGASVQKGVPLMTVADTAGKNLVITVNVPEADAYSLALGQDAEVKASALGAEPLKAKVTKISEFAKQAMIGNSQETVLVVELTADDPDGMLKSGYTIDASITTSIRENTVVVPLMATVSENGGLNYVYVIKDDYTIEKREVKIGEYSGIFVEVTGVEDGEKIVNNPTPRVQEGIFVKPMFKAGSQ